MQMKTKIKKDPHLSNGAFAQTVDIKTFHHLKDD